MTVPQLKNALTYINKDKSEKELKLILLGKKAELKLRLQDALTLGLQLPATEEKVAITKRLSDPTRADENLPRADENLPRAVDLLSLTNTINVCNVKRYIE